MLRSFSDRFLLLTEAGGLGDSGGGDGGTGGSGTGDSGAGGSGGGTEYVGPEWAKGWEGIEAELLSDPSLKAITSPASLVKSYVHAQKNMGKDKVILPTANSTKEERDTFYQKMGVPLEEQKYLESIKYDKEKNYLGEETAKGFIKAAHELRIHPDQASKLYELFNNTHKTNSDRAAELANSRAQTELDALQAKLGPEAYNVKLTKATNFIKENAPELFAHMGKTSLGKDAVLVDTFMKLAEKFNGEPNLPGGDHGGAMTLNDIQAEINEMMGTMDGPYFNPSHPDHKRQINHMLALQAKLEKAQQRG